MIYRIKLAAMGLLCVFSVAQSMEIQNWGYKARDKGYVGYFLPKQENPTKYPYFLLEKDNSESNRSFSDELLFATRMVEAGLPKDVAKEILYCGYMTEKTLDQDRMNRLKKGFKVNKTDFFVFL